MFKLISTHQLEAPTANCDHCGHAIAQLFFIHDADTGARMTVGCDCVQHFLAPDDLPVAEKADKRLKRAASQWRKQEPPALPNETRTEYINRRVCEMANAWKGYSVWVRILQKRPIGVPAGTFLTDALDTAEREAQANRYDFTNRYARQIRNL